MTGKKCSPALSLEAGWYGWYLKRVGDETNVIVVIMQSNVVLTVQVT